MDAESRVDNLLGDGVLSHSGPPQFRAYALLRGVHINVQEGERVKAGEPLMDGPRNPHDILDVLGEKELRASSRTIANGSSGTLLAGP